MYGKRFDVEMVICSIFLFELVEAFSREHLFILSTTLLIYFQKMEHCSIEDCYQQGLFLFALYQIQRVSLEDLNVAASHTNEHNMRRISQEAEHRKTSEGRLARMLFNNHDLVECIKSEAIPCRSIASKHCTRFH